MTPMPVNALVDLLTLILPDLEKIGEEEPKKEIQDIYDFFSLLYLAGTNHDDADERALVAMHVRDLKHVIMRW